VRGQLRGMCAIRRGSARTVESDECDTESECKDSFVCPVREDVKCGQEWLLTYVCVVCREMFSTFVRPRPGKLFFYFFEDEGPVPTDLFVNTFPLSLSSYIKLTYVLIINYGIIINSISTLMHTVWHVDKYKITFKLVINHWTNEIL